MTTMRIPFPACRLLVGISTGCLLALAFALFSQHSLGMRPCAWCVLQRLILLALALASALGALALYAKHSLLARLASAVALALSLAGMLGAWYQYSVAAKLFSCDMSFADRLMTQSGLESSLPWLFGIYANCMDARVDLLGVDYALWGLLLFTFCAGASLLSLVKTGR